jgi:PPOX class probable F420-dependent enzyme
MHGRLALRPSLRAVEQRLYRRLRSESAFSAITAPRVPWSVSELSGHHFCSIVSWRRDGRGVPTPVWFAISGPRIVFRSAASDGKIKRIRREGEVLVCPCSLRGHPLGPAMAGRARLLDEAEWPVAEAALRARYGAERRLYALLRDPLLEAAYVEVGPTAAAG